MQVELITMCHYNYLPTSPTHFPVSISLSSTLRVIVNPQYLWIHYVTDESVTTYQSLSSLLIFLKIDIKCKSPSVTYPYAAELMSQIADMMSPWDVTWTVLKLSYFNTTM